MFLNSLWCLEASAKQFINNPYNLTIAAILKILTGMKYLTYFLGALKAKIVCFYVQFSHSFSLASFGIYQIFQTFGTLY